MFGHWYLMHFMPANDHTNDYYRNFNQIAVVYWNDYYLRGKFRNVINCEIDYQSDIGYGIDVNCELYYYFTYIQDTYRIPLYSTECLWEI